MRTRDFVAAAVVLILAGGTFAADDKAKPEQIQVPILIRTDWVEVQAPEEADAPGRTETASALAIRRALEPETKAAYDSTNKALGCDPADLRRAFYLEKAQFLVGEPILAELRVSLKGPGEWRAWWGGNYRARGRDDNYLFLMRHGDGTWVGDPYAPIRGYMGGLGSFFGVTRDQPASSCLAVQRWCAIERPGTYDLYCLHAEQSSSTITGIGIAKYEALPERVKDGHYVSDDGTLIDQETGKESTRFQVSITIERHAGAKSPVLAKVPDDVIARAKENFWDIEHLAGYAHFRVVISEGTDDERRDMVARWTKTASQDDDGRSMYYRARAAREAVQYAQQDDFLPLIAKWLADDRDKDWNDLYGLAMRPSAKATELLLTCEPRDVLKAAHRLRRDKAADFIPYLIEWLAHESVEVRYWADWYLRQWTGEAFGHTWDPNDRDRPTLDEGRAMQPAWRDWWTRNEDDFVPPDHRSQ